MASAHMPHLTQHRLLLCHKDLLLVQIVHLGHQRTLHDRTALIILDIASPKVLVQRDILGKALLLKVPDSIVVSAGKEIVHARIGFADVCFEVVHEHPTVAFHLVCAVDREEDDLSEAALGERAEADPSNDSVAALDNGEASTVFVVYEAGDVFSWHFGELLLEKRLEACEDNERARVIEGRRVIVCSGCGGRGNRGR